MLEGDYTGMATYWALLWMVAVLSFLSALLFVVGIFAGRNDSWKWAITSSGFSFFLGVVPSICLGLFIFAGWSSAMKGGSGEAPQLGTVWFSAQVIILRGDLILRKKLLSPKEGDQGGRSQSPNGAHDVSPGQRPG